jgi:hypothetical protein
MARAVFFSDSTCNKSGRQGKSNNKKLNFCQGERFLVTALKNAKYLLIVVPQTPFHSSLLIACVPGGAARNSSGITSLLMHAPLKLE